MYSVALQYRLSLLAGVLLMSISSFVFAQSVENWAPINHGRTESAVVEYRDDLYVFNGFGANLKLETNIEKFSAATKTWSVIGSTSVAQGTAVTHNGIVRNGKDVWLIGGRLGNHPGRVSRQVWIFNLDANNWRKGPDLPVASGGGGAALVNNRIHWFGGFDQNARCDVNTHLVFDLSEPTAGWQDISSLARMPDARNHFSTAVVNDVIYAMGGQHGHDGCVGVTRQDLTLVHAFDPATNSWERKADLPAKQSHTEPSTFVYKGYIYVVGGNSRGDKVFQYNPNKNSWATVYTLPERFLAPISRIVDRKLMVASGGVPSVRNISSRVRAFEIDLPTVNANPQSVELFDDGNTQPMPSTGNTLISIEAEYYDLLEASSSHNWVHRTLAGASNADSLISSPNTGELRNGLNDSPMLSYLVYFDQPGTYHMWIRGLGDSDSAGHNDSVHAGLNGKIATSADKIDGFPAGWNWSKRTRDNHSATLNIPTTGIHAVNLWMREDGFAIDKIILTNNPDYVPTGVGPDADDGIVDSDVIVSDNEVPKNTNDDAVAQSGSLISIEVEQFSSRETAGLHTWIVSDKAGASGSSVVTNINIGTLRTGKTSSPMLSYSIDFAEAGSYQVWMRGWGDTVGKEGKNDSVHVGINGSLGNASGLQNFPARWSWSNEKRGGGTTSLVVPSAGQHTINIWMREDGLYLDKLVLTKDSDYVPTSIGPALMNSQGSVDSKNEDSDDNNTPSSSTDSSDTQGDTSGSPSTSTSTQELHIEAEAYRSRTTVGTHQWITGSKPDASGSSMVTNLNNGTLKPGKTGSAMMDYRVDFSEAGTYFVWVRGWGDTVGREGRDDSVHVGINGTLNTAAAIDSFPAQWNWSNSIRGGGKARIVVDTAGTHTVNIWMREDGLHVDKLVLTKDANYQPVQQSSTTAGTLNTANESVDASARWQRVVSANGSSVDERHETGGVTIGNKIYVLGGRGSRAVSVYDADTNRWAQKSAAPIELNHFQPVVLGNKIWVVGAFTGGYPSETSVSHVYSYAPATDTWKKEHQIPSQRRRGGAGAVVNNGEIIIVGGNTNGHKLGAKAWMDSYNPSTGQWTILENAPTARDHATIAIASNNLVVAGGRSSQHPNVFGKTVSNTDVYDLATQRWSQAKSIPTQRAGTMTVAVGDEIIVIGGESGTTSQAYKTVEAYNVRANSWRILQPLLTGRHSGVATVLGNKIHVITGSDRRGGSTTSESTEHEVLAF